VNGKIRAIQNTDETWSIVTKESSHYHNLRHGLTKEQAESLAFQLNKLLGCKLTNPDCPYCHGVGGCYSCDS